MSTVLSVLFKGYNKVYVILTGFITFFVYYVINRNAKLKINNENLSTSLKDLNNESRKIVIIQRKQAEIAGKPDPTRDDVHEWMRELHDRSTKQ
jgi:hypothetical protein